MFSSQSGTVKLSLAVVIGLLVLKVVVAVITGSISIAAQAADSLLDLLAIGITFLAVAWAAKPADEEHQFGHGKVEGVAAIIQAVLILIAAGLIISSAIQRIIDGSTVEMAEAGIGVMLVSVMVNVFLSRHLLKISRVTDSIALEAFGRNITADIYSTTGVLAGLVVIRFTGLNILDPIIALAVAILILKAGYDLMRKSFGGLIDVKLPEAEENIIRAIIIEHSDRIAAFHKLRTRKAGSQRYVDLHLEIPGNVSVNEAHKLCDRIEQELKNRLHNASLTIHVEPCTDKCDQCTVSCNKRKDS